MPMTVSAPTWSVVATVDEPPALVQSFVAWHLQLGAERIFLYCDNPGDPIAATLAHLPQVEVVACDAAHWARLCKSRPRRHQVRQARNAGDAYRRCGSDWLAHIDADEFLWSAADFGVLLASVDPSADGIVVQVAERLHRPDDPGMSVLEGVFRRPFCKPPRMGRRIFGPDYALTYRGLTGHANGKAFARTGRNLSMSIHRPQSAKGAPAPIFARPETDQIELLHFDGLTPRYWIYKLARMQRALDGQGGMQPSIHRRAQADALLADPDGGEALYRRLKLAKGNLPRLLQRRDLWSAPEFEPRPALAELFPGVAVDLSPDAMDAWLAENKPEIIDYLAQLQRPETDQSPVS